MWGMGKVAGLLRQRRLDLGWSLRQVEARAAALGVRLPTSTLARIEQGKADPEARSLFTLIHVYNLELLADAMELGALAGEATPSGCLEELTDRGERAWKAGDIAQALSHALAIRDHVADDPRAHELKLRALVDFATYARNLGKYRLARQMVDELLRQPLPRPLLVDTLVLAASVWRGLGSMEAALAMIERAAKRADPDDTTHLAFVEHQWAKLLLECGELTEARAHLDCALALYRRNEDLYNEVRALALYTEIAHALDGAAAALQCAREVVRLAEERDYGVLAASARLELGRLLLARGECDQSIDELRRGLSSSELLRDRRVQFFAHARLWKAYTAAGEERAARIALRHAAELAAEADETSDEVEEVRAAARGLAH